MSRRGRERCAPTVVGGFISLTMVEIASLFGSSINAGASGRIPFDLPAESSGLSRGIVIYKGRPPRDSEPYDVAVIGAGVVGCALAYKLSQYKLRVILIDKNFDVGEGTSKANSAIIHTGFDAAPGTLESRLVTEASRQWPELARKLKIPFLETSALLLAIDDEQARELPTLYRKALANGVEDVELLSPAAALELEPGITDEVRGALLIRRESVVDPWTTPIAYAEVALANGSDILLGALVTGVEDKDKAIKRIVTENGAAIPARLLVNVSGLGSRRLADTYEGEPFQINPRRGQFLVYDKVSRRLVNRILLPIPTKKSKGMLVAPTVFGNLLAGPTAEDLPPDADQATNTTVEGLQKVRESASGLCPSLENEPVIASYAGLRCNCAEGSYLVRFNDTHRGIVTVTGIRSTGLTSSITLAQYLLDGMVVHCNLSPSPDPEAVGSRPESRWPGWWRRPSDNPEKLAERPDYGKMLCYCEQVSRGEVLDALASPLKPRTLDGIKRRTRAQMGRCQGFNCSIPIARIVSEFCDLPLHQVTKRGPGTELAAQAAGGSGGGAISTRSSKPLSQTRHFRVVIVGAGPAGIGVALGLARRKVGGVVLIERAAEPGGVPGKYVAKRGGVPTFIVWKQGRVLYGEEVVDSLMRKLARTDTELWLESQVIQVLREPKILTVVGPDRGKIDITADVVILTCGAREMSLAQRGWLAGHRPARVFYTIQLLDLLDGDRCLPLSQPAVLGSDLIAYSAAAKLRSHGAGNAAVIDKSSRPAATLLERLYFRKWCRPEWVGVRGKAEISGPDRVEAIRLDGEKDRRCDGVVVSGSLIPNSELAVEAGLDVDMPGWRPVMRGGGQLSHPGWFVAGNMIGGFHGAEWCHSNGLRVGKAVAQYLKEI